MIKKKVMQEDPDACTTRIMIQRICLIKSLKVSLSVCFVSSVFKKIRDAIIPPSL